MALTARKYLGMVSGIVCPQCASPMGATDSVWSCPQCGAQYPTLAPGLPILLKDAWSWVAVSALAMHQLVRAGDQEVAAMSTNRSGPRAAQRVRLRDARRTSNKQLQQLAGTLAKITRVPDLLDAVETWRNRESEDVYTSSGVTQQLFSYAQRDWSRFAESEAEVAAVVGALRASLAAAGGDRQSAVVLGAGMARFAWELRADFARVFAVEKSLAMATAFQRLQENGLTFFEINEVNAMRVDDQVRRVEARPPDASANAGEFSYLVGDAGALPLPPASQSAVVSAYFTDVLPLSSLLPAVKRVLRPGGVFLHFGPLGYHFSDPAEKLAAEEVREVFARAGFALVHEDVVTTNTLGSAARMGNFQFHNWSFAAVLRQGRLGD